MARLTVIDVEEQTRVPFLRGILTRSLQNAGLPFDEAYRLANEVRKELGDAVEIANVELRARVRAHLAAFGSDVAGRYDVAAGAPEAIAVSSPDGETAPYSRGRQRIDLMSSGLSPEDAAAMVSKIFRLLSEGRPTEVEASDLIDLTRETIARELDPEAAERYMVWQRYQASDRPLLVFVGGTVGTGKSTISTELAHRLGIVRIQSTDMLREVMRTLIPQSLLPALYESTYTAWTALPGPVQTEAPTDAQLAEGYLSQAGPVSLASEAVVQRALKERVSLIVEGVHIHPEWLHRIQLDTDAIMVPIMLAVLSRKQLKKRIKGRGRKSPDRRAERYLTNIDGIWQLQSYLLSEADEAQVAIVFNEDQEATVHQSMRVILDALAKHFASPAEPTG